MSVEVKTSADHPSSMAERAAKRLRPSGDPRADYHKQMGDGPTRTHTHGFHSGHVVFPETRAREAGPQEQRWHDAATTQQETKAYFTGHKRGDEGDSDDR
jgi:hypothetical protein